LRLGLVIDTSGSIKDRFSFEQDAAASFAGQVLTDKDDVAFVVSFANSVLLIQDFTAEQRQISSHIGELAPAGGTAVWDAVSFAADKLANRQESQPVARILVVIGDGEDNCSKVSLQNAIRRAEHGDVIVYTVSTREDSREVTTPSAGDHALKLLAERTGGAAFFPGSLEHLKLSLTQLQQLIRSRYLISYKPALFKRDGQYRTIDVSAQKSGHKLRVYARKGYYAPHDTVGKED
jgi:Ca-activated chloride channel homolog